MAEQFPPRHVRLLEMDGSGRLSIPWFQWLSDLGIDGGTYVPVATIVANLTTFGGFIVTFTKIRNIVTVVGRFDFDEIAGATQTEGRITLPIASNIVATTDIAGMGVATGDANPQLVCRIVGDPVNDAALFQWISVSTVARSMRFSFTYTVLP